VIVGEVVGVGRVVEILEEMMVVVGIRG